MPDDEEIWDTLLRQAANDLNSGTPAISVARELINAGVDTNVAYEMVDSLQSRIRRYKRLAGGKIVAIGLGMATLGVLITATSFALAKPGEYYLVSYGLVLVGLVNVVRGAWKVIRA